MNKITYCLITAVALCAISACVQNAPTGRAHTLHALYACGSSTDEFRINMTQGYSASLPPSPAPISPNNMWVDVADWECFLNDAGFNATSPPDDNFGPIDKAATVRFQNWAHGTGNFPHVPYPGNGIVDQYTYAAAVASKMTPYPTITTAISEAKVKHHHGGPTPVGTPTKSN